MKKSLLFTDKRGVTLGSTPPNYNNINVSYINGQFVQYIPSPPTPPTMTIKNRDFFSFSSPPQSLSRSIPPPQQQQNIPRNVPMGSIFDRINIPSVPCASCNGAR